MENPFELGFPVWTGLGEVHGAAALRSHAVQHRVKTRPRPPASHSRALLLEMNGLAMMRPPNCRSHEPKHCAPRVQDEMPEGILGSKYVDMDLNNIESSVYKKRVSFQSFLLILPVLSRRKSHWLLVTL